MLGVCGCLISEDSYGAGVHGSWIELTSLAANLFQLPVSLINPTVLAWMSFVYPWMRVSLLVSPYSLWNHAQLGGGSFAEILMSALAYGWVERWLGGTLQRHSWLRDELLHKISISVLISTRVFIY